LIEFKSSPIALVNNLISKKWMIDVIECIMIKRQRFSDLQELIPDISSKILSLRLKELFDLQLINKVIFNMIPLTFKYQITDKGKLMRKIFYEMGLVGSIIFRGEIFGDKLYSRNEIKDYFKSLYDIETENV